MWLTVVKDLFREAFTYEFITQADNPVEIGQQLRKVLRIILDAIILVKREEPALLSQQLCKLIIRCFVDAGESEWIPVEGTRVCPLSTCSGTNEK